MNYSLAVFDSFRSFRHHPFGRFRIQTISETGESATSAVLCPTQLGCVVWTVWDSTATQQHFNIQGLQLQLQYQMLQWFPLPGTESVIGVYIFSSLGSASKPTDETRSIQVSTSDTALVYSAQLLGSTGPSRSPEVEILGWWKLEWLGCVSFWSNLYLKFVLVWNSLFCKCFCFFVVSSGF